MEPDQPMHILAMPPDEEEDMHDEDGDDGTEDSPDELEEDEGDH